MRRSSRCPRCRKRTVHAPGACVGCGGALQPRSRLATAGPARWLAMGIAVVLAAVTFLAVNYSDRYLPAVSDWYLDQAVPELAPVTTELTAAPVEERAYYLCVRSVVKRIEEEGAIATFAGPLESRMSRMEDGRYRVNSYLVESSEAGERRLRSFTCVVRGEGGRWAVDQLALEPVLIAAAPTAPVR
jgi:hypothetical protein